MDKELVGEVRAAVQPAAPVHIVDEATVNDRGLGGLRGDMFGDEGAAEASAAADPEPAAVADVPPSEGPPPDSAAAEANDVEPASEPDLAIPTRGRTLPPLGIGWVVDRCRGRAQRVARKASDREHTRRERARSRQARKRWQQQQSEGATLWEDGA